MTVAFTISALLLGIIGAVAAGTGTVAPPPKIAFVTTNANVAPDALTVGPMAGRLGAPLFITNKDALGESTKDALVAYGADLIIVAGGPNTVTDTVLAQIAAATGLDIKQASDTPDTGIIRVSGDGRDETAVALSTLIAAYNPKFLPTDATAADSDLLDGKDSTEFLGATAKAADADKLDGKDSTAFMQTTIPSGTTVYGVIGERHSPATATELASSASLPGLAPVGLDDAHVEVAGADGDGTECPGTAVAPTAAPGYVCIYVFYTANATANAGYIWGSGDPSFWGFQVSWDADTANPAALFANWAYTAP
jgi:hypothetical protein